jgi:NAD+ synthase
MDLVDAIAGWLQDVARRAGATGYVVGLSGGIDSACTAVLCRRAMGQHVLGALLPCHSEPHDAEMARLVAETFALETVTVDLGPAYDAMLSALPGGLPDMVRANLKPRLRMAALYALAQARGYLVAGTGNRSEIMVGYFTKYGDGGVDVEPLGDLYKSEVRALARELDVPRPVVERPPSAGLWAGQTDEEEMGLTYRELDRALAAIDAGRTAGIDPDLLDRVQGMVAASAHKRSLPPVFRVERPSGDPGGRRGGDPSAPPRPAAAQKFT